MKSNETDLLLKSLILKDLIFVSSGPPAPVCIKLPSVFRNQNPISQKKISRTFKDVLSSNKVCRTFFHLNVLNRADCSHFSSFQFTMLIILKRLSPLKKYFLT